MNKNLLLTAVVSIAIGVFLGIFYEKSIGKSGDASVAPRPNFKMDMSIGSNTALADMALNALELPVAMVRTANGELVPVFFEGIDTSFVALSFAADSNRSLVGPTPKCCPANPLCCRKVVEDGDPTNVNYDDLNKIVFSYDYSRVGEGELEVILLSEEGEVLSKSRTAGNTYNDTAAKTFYATAGKPGTQFTGNATLLLRYTSRSKVLFTRTIDLDVK